MPNGDVTYSDIEVMKLKPKMPPVKRKASRNSHGSKSGSGYHGLNVQPESDTNPLSPAIRRSAINNLVGINSNTSSTDDSKYSIRNEPLPDMRSAKNTPENKRFNVRIASINSSSDSNPIVSPHSIVGNSVSKSNPLSHREKDSMKDSIIKKYNKANEPIADSMNLPYPGN